MAAALQTAWGRDHLPNRPTEEIFTSPHLEHTEGIVTSTKRLLVSGRLVSGLRVRVQRGRAVQIDADEGAPFMREVVRRDIDAGRLGEVPLGGGFVCPDSRVWLPNGSTRETSDRCDSWSRKAVVIRNFWADALIRTQDL